LPEDDVFFYKIYRHLLMGNFDKADSTYKAWVASQPDSAVVLVNYAKFLDRYKNDIKGAIEQFEKSFQIDPNRKDTILSLGLLYSQIGEQQKAQKLYLDYLESNASDETILYYLGALYFVQGNLELAEKYLVKASVLPKANSSIFSRLSLLYFNLGKLSESISSINEGILVAKQGQELATLIDYEISIYYKTKQFDEAFLVLDRKRKELEKTGVPIQVNYGTIWMYAELWMQSGKIAEYETILNQAIDESTPENISVWDIPNFRLQLKLRKLEKAKKILQKIEVNYPEYKDHFYRIQYLQTLGKHEEAINLGVPIITQETKDGRKAELNQNLHNWLFIAPSLVELERWQYLIDGLEANIAVSPYEPEANYYLGLAYYKINKNVVAKKALSKAIHMWKDADKDVGLVVKARKLYKQLTTQN